MFCIVCKNKLHNNYKIIHENVRDDENKSSKIIICDYCTHIQLFGYRENLKEHYEKDLQTFDNNGNLRDLKLDTIILLKRTHL